ncbi:MAG: DUF1326 domain-containing protein [Acidobacteria bacterium]|nr:DUF1326 domain-containing protein [Acidobacteriota bacterium]
MPYELEGRLLEVCDCKVLCPCWIGEDPDNGTCDGVVTHHFDKGTIDGVDVSGLSIALLGRIPGNILQGNWKVVVVIDDKASPQQEQALMNCYSGKLGGPVADLAKLVGEIVSVQRAPIGFQVTEGKGTLSVGTMVDTEMAPYKSPLGQTTTLNESAFSTIPGSPAYVSKASHYKRNTSAHGIPDVDLKNCNAIQGSFRFVA